VCGGGCSVLTRRSLIVGATAVLVAAAVAVVVLASRRGDARLSLVPFFDVGPATLASPAPGVVDDEHVAVIPYRDGGVVRYVFALHNDGPEAVVVTEVVAPPPESETLLRPVAMGLAATGRIVGPGIGTSAGDVLNADANEPDVEPFHAFSLAPGDERAVYVWARMGNCEFNAPGSAETLVGVRVRYTVHGESRETRLSLPLGVRITVPIDVQCPRRLAAPRAAQPPPVAPQQSTPAGVPPG